MHREEEPYGSWTLAAASGAVMLAQAFHPTMLLPLREGETAAWLLLLVGGLLALAVGWPAAAALAARPGGNLISLARSAAGAPGAVATGLLVAGLLVYHCGMVIRQSAEMAVSSLYPHTPATFAMASLLVSALYGAWGGVGDLARLCRLFLPFLTLAILAVLGGNLGWGELRYLLPFWGPGPAAVLVRSVGHVALFVPLALVLLVGAGRVPDRQRLARAWAAATLGSASLLAAAAVLLVITYPLPFGQSIAFPLFELTRLVTGGRFFERMEGLWLLVWVYATACHLAALLQAAAVAYADAFGLAAHRTALMPLAGMAAALALFPPDVDQATAWHRAGVPAGVGIGFGLPLALALLAAWRKGRAGRHGA